MQLGIHLPHAGEQATPGLIRRAALRTTVLREVCDEAVHRGEVGGVNQLATQPLLTDEAGALQVLQMERER